MMSGRGSRDRRQFRRGERLTVVARGESRAYFLQEGGQRRAQRRTRPVPSSASMSRSAWTTASAGKFFAPGSARRA